MCKLVEGEKPRDCVHFDEQSTYSRKDFYELYEYNKSNKELMQNSNIVTEDTNDIVLGEVVKYTKIRTPAVAKLRKAPRENLLFWGGTESSKENFLKITLESLTECKTKKVKALFISSRKGTTLKSLGIEEYIPYLDTSIINIPGVINNRTKEFANSFSPEVVFNETRKCAEWSGDYISEGVPLYQFVNDSDKLLPTNIISAEHMAKQAPKAVTSPDFTMMGIALQYSTLFASRLQSNPMDTDPYYIFFIEPELNNAYQNDTPLQYDKPIISEVSTDPDRGVHWVVITSDKRLGNNTNFANQMLAYEFSKNDANITFYTKLKGNFMVQYNPVLEDRSVYVKVPDMSQI